MTYTTIRIKKSTKEMLDRLVEKKEPVGDVIERLLEEYENREGGDLGTENNFR